MDVQPFLEIHLSMYWDVQTMMEMDTQTMAVPRTQWNDSDWDGYGDNINGYQGDACPTVLGTSNRNETGAINDNLRLSR